jgi:hypothetical protein
LKGWLVRPAQSIVANSSLSFTITVFDAHLRLRFLVSVSTSSGVFPKY